MDLTKLNGWQSAPGSGDLWMKILITLVLGFGLVFALTKAPTQARRPIVWIVTFLAGLVFVLYQYWPQPINYDKKVDLPGNTVERFGIFMTDTTSVVGTVSQVLAALMLGLGIFSVLKIHGTRIMKQQKDWAFSVVLIASLLLMVIFGYWDDHIRVATKTIDFDNSANWTFANMGRDFLFEGLLQQMDAAMFSIIAFFILSAAYRAFRARSVEATILLGTALLVILSLMGMVAFYWDMGVDRIAGEGSAKDLVQNLRISEIANWIKNTFQTPAITGIKFGIGLGTLSMALRIWLGLERGGK